MRGQRRVGGVPATVPDRVGIVSAAGASWGGTEGAQWWAGSGSEDAVTMPHSAQLAAKELQGHHGRAVLKERFAYFSPNVMNALCK